MSSDMYSNKIGTIGWIDLTVDNAENVRDFYAAITGWTFENVDMGGYSDFVMKAPGVEKGVAGVCHARGMNAGLPPQWLIYITVDDLDKSIEACNARGGEVISGPRNYGNEWRYCVIRDPGGAVAGLIGRVKG